MCVFIDIFVYVFVYLCMHLYIFVFIDLFLYFCFLWGIVSAEAKQALHKATLKAVTQGLHNPPQLPGKKGFEVKAPGPPLPEEADDLITTAGPKR